jgi:hypothetical protein
MVARLVEVLQVERVVPRLVERGALDPPLADLELDHHNDFAEQQHRIDASTHAGDRELEEDTAVACMSASQDFNSSISASQACVCAGSTA